MNIKMLHTRIGAEDGFNLREYESGKSYDVADTMARMFLRNGWAYNDEEQETENENNI